MKRKTKYHSLNLELQLENQRLRERIGLLELKLEQIVAGKDRAYNEYVDRKIKDMNTVTRSINGPRKGETNQDVGRRYVTALTALHEHGIEAAKQFFDQPPKDK